MLTFDLTPKNVQFPIIRAQIQDKQQKFKTTVRAIFCAVHTYTAEFAEYKIYFIDFCRRLSVPEEVFYRHIVRIHMC